MYMFADPSPKGYRRSYEIRLSSAELDVSLRPLRNQMQFACLIPYSSLIEYHTQPPTF